MIKYFCNQCNSEISKKDVTQIKITRDKQSKTIELCAYCFESLRNNLKRCNLITTSSEIEVLENKVSEEHDYKEEVVTQEKEESNSQEFNYNKLWDLYDFGLSITEIAKQCNCSYNKAYYIINRYKNRRNYLKNLQNARKSTKLNKVNNTSDLKIKEGTSKVFQILEDLSMKVSDKVIIKKYSLSNETLKEYSDILKNTHKFCSNSFERLVKLPKKLRLSQNEDDISRRTLLAIILAIWRDSTVDITYDEIENTYNVAKDEFIHINEQNIDKCKYLLDEIVQKYTRGASVSSIVQEYYLPYHAVKRLLLYYAPDELQRVDINSESIVYASCDIDVDKVKEMQKFGFCLYAISEELECSVEYIVSYLNRELIMEAYNIA